jgi:Beta protein
MGFDHRHYVPILKGRAGEYTALREMTPDVKGGLTPLIEVPPIPWDFELDEPDKTIDQHLERLSSQIVQSWGVDRPLFLDLLWIAPEERMPNGDHPLTHVFRTAREDGLQLIPVTGLVRGEEYQFSCRDIIAEDARGVCIRLQKEDFEESDDLSAQVGELLNRLGVHTSAADLVLDLRSMALDEGSTLQAAIPVLVRSIPALGEWRSFTLAGTAFPETLIELPPSSFSMIARLEWIIWRNLIVRARIFRLPSFGDYTIASPQPSEVDPRIMRPSASIRYNINDAWLIPKARNLRDF